MWVGFYRWVGGVFMNGVLIDRKAGYTKKYSQGDQLYNENAASLVFEMMPHGLSVPQFKH